MAKRETRTKYLQTSTTTWWNFNRVATSERVIMEQRTKVIQNESYGHRQKSGLLQVTETAAKKKHKQRTTETTQHLWVVFFGSKGQREKTEARL